MQSQVVLAELHHEALISDNEDNNEGQGSPHNHTCELFTHIHG